MSPVLAHAAGIVASTAMLALCSAIEKPEVFLLWGALAPWLAALERDPDGRRTVASAVAMSIGFTFAVFSWFPPAVVDFTGVSPVAAFAALALTAPLLEPQFLAFAVVRWGLRRRGATVWWAAVAATGAWVAVDSRVRRAA